MTSPIGLTLISPIYNEEGTILELVDRSIAAIRRSGLFTDDQWEYILVDDASQDASPRLIAQAMERYPGIVVGVRHAKQMGQGGALQTGFYLGRGGIFSTLDADLEKLPEDTPRLLKLYKSRRCDIVCSYLRNKNLTSRVGNQLLKMFFSYNVHQISTNQMVLSARFIKGVPLVKNDQRYVVPIAMSQGARFLRQIATHYQKRRSGVSKYDLKKKVLQGIPEMLDLKFRIKRGFYNGRLDKEYKKNFTLLQPSRTVAAARDTS